MKKILAVTLLATSLAASAQAAAIVGFEAGYFEAEIVGVAGGEREIADDAAIGLFEKGLYDGQLPIHGKRSSGCRHQEEQSQAHSHIIAPNTATERQINKATERQIRGEAVL